jgi:hypothetical protein
VHVAGPGTAEGTEVVEAMEVAEEEEMATTCMLLMELM